MPFNLDVIQSLKSHLDDMFTIKDLGKARYFLGIEIDYLPSSFMMSQRKYSKDLLVTLGLELTKNAVTPLPVNLRFNSSDGDLLPNPEFYRSLVGKLNYLTNTRPDHAFTVQSLSQFMNTPRTPHLAALHYTLRYVAHTVNQGILLNSFNELKLHAFSGADWASCPESRRSITCYIILLGNSPITWKSKKQPLRSPGQFVFLRILVFMILNQSHFIVTTKVRYI